MPKIQLRKRKASKNEKSTIIHPKVLATGGGEGAANGVLRRAPKWAGPEFTVDGSLLVSVLLLCCFLFVCF